MMITKIYKYNLITLPHVNLLFDHMLMNQITIHTNISQINKKHGELTKLLFSWISGDFIQMIKEISNELDSHFYLWMKKWK